MNLCVAIICGVAAMLTQDRTRQDAQLPSLDARWRELLALDDRWNASLFSEGEKQLAGDEAAAAAALNRSNAILLAVQELAER